jgi:hypothetical protein
MTMTQSIQDPPRVGTRKRVSPAPALADGSMVRDCFSP